MHRLRATIPSARLAPYVAACDGADVDPMDLYRWAGKVALAVFDDVGNLEVAMRSAMAGALADEYGITWYNRSDILDDPTLKLIRAAWTSGGLGALERNRVGSDILHGKLVATLMFGFWVKLLGRGEYQGQGEARARRIYDAILWKPALRHAFPNVGDFDRRSVEQSARVVNKLRNRVAHHEHIVWGLPMNDTSTRLPLAQAHSELLQLASYLSLDLRAWLDEHSTVNAVVDECPLPSASPLFL